MTITNDKNKNNWLKKNFLTWVYNPFFLFFVKEDNRFNPLLNTDHENLGNTEFFDGTLYKNDADQWDSISDKPGPNQLFNDFFDQNEGILPLGGGGLIPVYAITYIFSLYIAISPRLRGYFYGAYDGSTVPCITQFLLNHIRIGPLDNNYYLNEIK